jgi:hypothetical protein
MQHLSARSARALRQYQLVPDYAPIEPPWIEMWFAKFDDLNSGLRAYRVGQASHVFAYTGCGTDCKLRIERDLHFRSGLLVLGAVDAG